MIEPWEIMSSRVELEDRWIKVRSDSCRRSDGVVIEPYYVLEYPDWVCVLPITSQGDVVLTREYRHGAGLVVTGLPSGVVDKTDITPMNTAKRELLEETGYTSQHVIALGSLYANWTNQDNMIHYFLALDAKLTGPAQARRLGGDRCRTCSMGSCSYDAVAALEPPYRLCPPSGKTFGRNIDLVGD